MSEKRNYGFDTLQVHAGQVPDPATGASAVPIYQTTSFMFKDFAAAQGISSGEMAGYDYTRIVNPTNHILENRIAALEGGSGALAVAPGSAATAYSILNSTHTGDNIVAAKTLYGGSFHLFVNTLPKHGVTTTLVDPIDPKNFERAIDEKTKAIFIEMIGNPDINIVDFDAVAAIAAKHTIPLIVDNTFGTPFLFTPFEHGANVIVHSATKFIGGHGTSIGGIIVDGGNFDWASGKFPDFTTSDPAYSGFIHAEKWGNQGYIVKARHHYMRDSGACMSPFNAFLFLEGIETLSLRVERQVRNAQKVAEYLSGHPQVGWVNYPRHQGRIRAGQAFHRKPRALLLPRQRRRLEVPRRAPRHCYPWAALGGRTACGRSQARADQAIVRGRGRGGPPMGPRPGLREGAHLIQSPRNLKE
jgi:O-acetylhomoserine (thiol)-lyase